MKLLKQILEDNNIPSKYYDSSIFVGDLTVWFRGNIIHVDRNNFPIFRYHSPNPDLEKLAKVLPYLHTVDIALENFHSHPEYEKFRDRIISVVKELNSDFKVWEDKDIILVIVEDTELGLVFDLGYEENWEALDVILSLIPT